MRVIAVTAVAVIATAVALAVGASPSRAPVTPEAPGELIIRFERGVGAEERREVRQDADAAFQRSLPVPGMQVLDLEPGQSLAAAERALERADGVLYAERNVVRRAFLRPNDPYFHLLWGMENTGQAIRDVSGTPDADADVTDAWDLEAGAPPVIAVVDSGVDGTHPDLAANVWRNPGESTDENESNGVDDDGNGRVDDWRGWDFTGADNDPADENGHGTHVAGTIGADRGNDVGVAGAADGAPLMPLRVLDAEGSGRVSDVILAYSYAAANGARIVNLSLGSLGASQAERDTIASFPGLLFVAAAGNGGEDGVGDDNDVTPTYPCAYDLPNVVCVAASDNRDALADFSNFGAVSVDLVAPGVEIASTWPGGRYSWSSGTSMATPLVSGAAALIWAAAPDATVADVRAALLSGVDAAGAFQDRTATGGRLNALRSLRLGADVGVGSPASAPPPDGSSAAPPPGDSQSAPRPDAGTTPSPPPGAADVVAPRLSVTVRRRARAAALARRGLTARMRCSETCRVRTGLHARRTRIGRAATTSVAGSESRRVTLRLTRAGRRLFRVRRPSSLVLVARAADASRNMRTLRVRIRVSR